MRILTLDEFSWRNTNDSLREKLGLKDFAGSVFAFQSIYQGLFEITLSLSQLYSHKTELLLPLECGPYWTKLASDCTRIALRSHVIPSREIPGKIGTKVQTKSLLAAFTAIDDPWLGHIYQSDWIAALVSEKVFSLKVIHHEPFEASKLNGLNPFEGYLWSLGPNLCVAILGERMKVNPFATPFGNWSAPLEELNSLSRSPANQDHILKFEKEVGQLGATPMIKTEQRVWDRAVISWNDIDGSAVRSMLIEDYGVNPGHVETLSGCRWPLMQKFDWLYAQGFLSEQVRGSLIIDKILVNDEKFIDALQKSISTIRTLQS